MRPTARDLIRPAAVGILLAVIGRRRGAPARHRARRPLTVTATGLAVPLVVAVLFTVVGGVVGYGLALLGRRAGRPRTPFLAITLVALAVYAVVPFTATPLGTALWLNLMHLVAAAAILPLLARALPAARVPAAR